MLTIGYQDSSDAFRIHVCDICGLMAVANLKKQEFYCSVCRNSTQISQVYIPYAAKLLFQEVSFHHVYLRGVSQMLILSPLVTSHEHCMSNVWRDRLKRWLNTGTNIREETAMEVRTIGRWKQEFGRCSIIYYCMYLLWWYGDVMGNCG